MGASLKLNAGKMKAIVFSNNRYINSVMSNSLLRIDLGDGIKISLSNSVKRVGIILNSKLTWKNHIDKVAKTFNSVLYHLRFFRKYTSQALRKRLVEALLFPHLDYCSVVLLDASQELRRRLQVMQNSGVRYVIELRRDDQVSPHSSSFGWLCTDTRRRYFMAVLMNRIVCMRIPDCLVGLFTRHVPRECVREDTKELKLPLMRKDYDITSFQIQGAHEWNALPAEIRHLASLSRFKLAVKWYLSDLD